MRDDHGGKKPRPIRNVSVEFEPSQRVEGHAFFEIRNVRRIVFAGIIGV